VDPLGQIIQDALNFVSQIIIPDWAALLQLLPVLLLIGVVGPLLTLIALGWVLYLVGKPRDRIRYTDPIPHAAEVVDGKPVYPVGEPYCPVDQLVFPFGTTRCPNDGRDLAVICPKCGTGRQAHVERCSTCGLVLKIDRTVPALRPVGPPPGGAAAA